MKNYILNLIINILAFLKFRKGAFSPLTHLCILIFFISPLHCEVGLPDVEFTGGYNVDPTRNVIGHDINFDSLGNVEKTQDIIRNGPMVPLEVVVRFGSKKTPGLNLNIGIGYHLGVEKIINVDNYKDGYIEISRMRFSYFPVIFGMTYTLPFKSVRPFFTFNLLLALGGRRFFIKHKFLLTSPLNDVDEDQNIEYTRIKYYPGYGFQPKIGLEFRFKKEFSILMGISSTYLSMIRKSSKITSIISIDRIGTKTETGGHTVLGDREIHYKYKLDKNDTGEERDYRQSKKIVIDQLVHLGLILGLRISF